MQKKNYKGRCERKQLSKCSTVCRFYSKIQSAYADVLQENDEIVEFRCYVLLDGLSEGEYTTDFVCTKKDGTLRVRECVERKYLTKPGTAKLLEASRQYWFVKRGVEDWGIVIDKKKEGESSDEEG